MKWEENEKGIGRDRLETYHERFSADNIHRIAQNAVSNAEINDIALNRNVLARMEQVFSHEIETGKITNQKQSGRCWMFAGLNALRIPAIRKMNVETFEFSENYCMFWDKLEKSNYFLESIIETREEETSGRTVMWILRNPISDGGQWDMFINLVRKYGVVPKSLMPETVNSSNTKSMNTLLTAKLREDAVVLRKMHTEGKPVAYLREQKREMLNDIYRMLAINCGEPPTEFRWEYRDKEKKFHRDDGITPTQFYDKYVGLNLRDYVSLINCPTSDKPFDRHFTIQYLGSVLDGDPIRYLNADIGLLRSVALKMIQEGEPVWFGSDTGKMMHRTHGILDPNLFDYEMIYGADFKMTKGERVEYGHSQMTHAMVLLGADVVDGKPVKWKVENSWGEDPGQKGLFVMSDDWFTEYLFQVVVPIKHLPTELARRLEDDPIVLKPWDPMGSLAMMH